MAKYKVDITGINTSEIEVLSNEEMTKLFVEYQNGNLDAKERLINGNLKLVLSILRSFNKGNVNLDDLFQVGVIGLIKAIDNFDLSYGLKLSTYAVPLIIGEIKRYIRDNTAVRVSRSTKDLAYQIIKFKEKYISDYGVEPPALVISKELGIDEYLIGYAMDAMKDPASIFEPIYNDGGDTIYLFDQLADTKDKNSDKDMIISLRRALLKIKEREKDILLQRFMFGKTQMEIADEMGISQAQVSRLEKSAIINVRKLIK
ncbi:sigma-70 family RNA polymerase sigma factor [bacterium]|nr:sigma-70 family RNA polymerase sigma factor [bacterium]